MTLGQRPRIDRYSGRPCGATALVVLAIVGVCAIELIAPQLVRAAGPKIVVDARTGIASRPASFATIRRLLDKHRWSDGDDPRLVMTYCEALVETNAEVPEALGVLAPTVFRFATGYWTLLRGDSKAAAKVFNSLLEDKRGGRYGYIGLLEKAQYTGNIASMGPLLDGLSRARQDGLAVPVWVEPYFRGVYSLGVGKYREVAELVQVARVQGDLQGSMLIELQVPLLLREDRLSEAKLLLANTRPLTQELIVSHANIVAVDEGYEASSHLLKDRLEQFPHMWKVAEAYLFHALETVRFDNRRSVPYLNALVDLQRRRPYDIRLKLLLANALFDTGDPIAALTQSLLEDLRSADEFVSYDLLVAKLALLSQSLATYKNSVDKASAKAPLDPSVLWFSYQAADRLGANTTALENLNELLRPDPRNLFVLEALVKTYSKLGQEIEAQRIAEQIKSVRRNVGAHHLDRTWD